MTTNVDVRCGCGAMFTSSESTVRRQRRLGIPHTCPTCKKTSRPTDAGQRWWIRRFGGVIPTSMSVETYVHTNGLPTGLSELVASLKHDG